MLLKIMLTNVLLFSWLLAPTVMSQDLTKSSLGLYVTASEAFQMLQQQPHAILVDVRDPVEIKFTGFATPTKIHVPWLLTDISNWSEENASWPMQENPNFDQQILNRLAELGAGKDTPIILMCRSGATRSAPAVDRLANYGYSNVWSVTDGFEGNTLKEGPSKGVRAVNGWRNSGLPWSYQLPAAVAWQAPVNQL
ncbi:sulfurtransferase [Arsukibacterium sp. MJ3]|uniref:rhodanese-like domain-containing protein n=1 Tax=Arsukibacterium sp. MJ3 TaxID=1632859 RepID=UPI0006273047|nr:rhodanese-like domain-containing protein [Arsukibacterium sp. MJ3]KKO49000.1 sulfurtransferase [Arsukibacterium sp. MJ3]